MLVIGATLLIKSFWRIQHVDAGFRSDRHPQGGVSAAAEPLSGRTSDDSPTSRRFTPSPTACSQKAERLPGVEAAAVSGYHPLDPGFTNSFRIIGREAEAATQPEISIRRVTPGYFRTMGVPLVRGRLLADSDTTTAPPVLLINEAAAQRFFDGQEPLGKQINFWGANRTIVGIIGNERFQGLAEAPPIAAYAPLDQAPSANGGGVLLVRTSGDPRALIGSVRGAIREQDPALAVFGLEPFAETVSRSVAERRFTMLVLGLLAVGRARPRRDRRARRAELHRHRIARAR